MCIIFPPLAVIDKGCGSIVITTILTLIGWVPGVIAALGHQQRKVDKPPAGFSIRYGFYSQPV
jgi:uncharacterized membrane protein YqaE (UPF0057 family)